MPIVTPEVHTAVRQVADRWLGHAARDDEAQSTSPEVISRRAENCALVEALLLLPMGTTYKLNDVIADVRRTLAADPDA